MRTLIEPSKQLQEKTCASLHTFAFPQFQTFGGGMSRIPNPSAKSPISPRLASAGSLGSPAVGSLEASPGSTLDNRGVSPIGARPWTGPGDHHDLPQPVQQQDESAARLPPRPPSAQSVSSRPSSRYWAHRIDSYVLDYFWETEGNGFATKLGF